MEKLFSLYFIDGSNITVSYENNNIICSTYGNGISQIIRKSVDKMEYRFVCAWGYNYFTNDKLKSNPLIVKYIDHIEEESIKLSNQLIIAC